MDSLRLASFFRRAIPVIAILWQASVGDAATTYSIVTLDVLPGGGDTYATGINDLGVVVGHSAGHVGFARPIMWDSSGVPTELWTNQVFGGIPADINNRGQVVGRYGSGSVMPLPGPGIPGGGAFIWEPTTREFRDLGDLGGVSAQATAINDAGQIAGSSQVSEGDPRAFIWDADNGMRSLGTLGGGWSFGNDINSSGQIAGYSWRADGSEHAYLWDPATGMQDLGSPGRLATRAYGLNDKADVVGVGSITAEMGGGLRWSQGQMTGIYSEAVDFSFAWDINNRGQVVGYGTGNGRLFASIWDDVNGPQILEKLVPSAIGWEFEVATAINDRGQIVGYGRLNERVRGFLLTPIPEPNSLLMAVMTSTCAVIMVMRHRPVFR